MKTTYEFLKEKLQNINSDFSYQGENFGFWQVEAKKKLSQLLGMDKFEKVMPETNVEYTQQIEGALEIRFTFQSEKNYRIPCHLLIPNGTKNPPVVICLQGHSPGMHISLGRLKNKSEESLIKNGDRDFCVRALKEGFAALAIEQRNFGELSGGLGCHEPSMNNIILGRTTIGERVWDIERVIDVLQDEFSDKIDTSCICVLGNSGGGTATAYASALDDRITLAVSSCAMATFKDSIGSIKHCTCNYIPDIANHFDMGDLMAMAYPKFFIQVSGKDDDIFPLFSAQKVFEDGKKAYSDNGTPERCALVIGNGGHRFYADDTWPIIHKFLDR